MRAARALALLASVALAWPTEGQSPRRDSARVASPGRDSTRGRDSSAVAALGQALRQRVAALEGLTIQLNTRIEARAQRTRNQRCFASILFRAGFECRSPLTPSLDAQFGLRTTGGFTERTRVDIDYDSEREFDGSNTVALSYAGKPNDRLQRIEIGNVSFEPPPSRFITSGIPSGNFGLQAAAKFGPLRVGAIAAQQKGNVARDQVFLVGARTSQSVERDIEDYQIEPRRFFFTVDPLAFGAAYPNIDILNARRMAELADALPDTLRPSRVFVYRLILGGQPPNPNGPRFQLLGDPTARTGQVYELLRESIDYYIDPSQLWLALLRPLALNNERLVVAFTLNIGGRDTVIARLGGTPDLEQVAGRPQQAHLLWDPQVVPGDAAFRREIRSAYRVGGEDIRRASVELRIIGGTAADQEKPPGASADTYLQLFGLAQSLNGATFDAENRLWPRPQDPNVLVSGVPGTEIFRDRFVIFPSLEPFSRRGLAGAPGVVANDTIYRTPSEYIYSSQHPPSFYRLRLRYDVAGGSGGAIALNAVQVRPASERLTMDNRPLVRGVDYEIDYELGRVTLLNPDTLGAPRRVVVRYEENPLFAAIPTSIVGLSSQWDLAHGRVSLVAISQSQRTTFTRPSLGFEPQAALVTGVSAAFGWDLPALARRLAGREATATAAPPRARLDVSAEVAVSRPLNRRGQQAYIESFEAEGGVNVNLLDALWQLSSQPALGQTLAGRYGGAAFDTSRAATLAFQNSGAGSDGRLVQFTIRDIDPQAAFAGIGISPPEQVLWLSLFPLAVGGKYDQQRQQHRWQTGSRIAGRRWRSIRTVFGAAGSGIDLSRAEQLEFWALIDTMPARRGRNPVLVFDFGDVSENSVALVPDSIVVRGGDSLFFGRRLEGFNRLDSERDRFSRAFNADVNDLGIPGDVADAIKVVGSREPIIASNFALCALSRGRTRVLGDPQGNCTARNGRLDEEDIDQDALLNFNAAQREQERVRRFIVDLSDRRFFSRVGTCGAVVRDVNGAIGPDATLCWVQVRLPFTAPDDSTRNGPALRRVRALRLTTLSGSTLADDRFSMLGIARLRVVGAPWLKRASRPLRGVGGADESLTGSVVATVIGTQDRDSTRGIFYDSPPGVSDLPDQSGAVFANQQIQVNERSLRVQATEMSVGTRAEAFFRFPEGQKSLLGYRELRLWARGRGRGWGGGPQSDLQFFVKIGRDVDNFYLYRAPASAGNTRAAWEPEVRVRFERFVALRARLESAFLQGDSSSLGCVGVDSLLVAASATPAGGRRWAACEDGYVVYSIDPAVTPPNLAGVQELAVGIVRVDSLRGTTPLLPGDTAEVWIDDVRLADVTNTTGYAGEIAAALDAGEHGTLRLGLHRRDPNYRQLGEAPTFRTADEFDLAATWRLDRLLPAAWAMAIPLTLSYRGSRVDPRFLTNSDIEGAAVRGLRTPRSRATTVTVSLRRRTPIERSWVDPILNALIADGSFSALGHRTEFQNARVRDGQFGVDLASGRFGSSSPGGALVAAALPNIGPVRLSPTFVRITSAYVGGDDRRQAFLKPAAAADDPAPHVRGAERLWRSSTTLEWRPLPRVTARWDAVSAHDLRAYEGNSLLAAAARRERGSLLGVDIGLERQRTMNASVVIAPPTSGWLRPRVALGSTYAMLRDPNNPSYAADPDAGGREPPQLTRRLGNTQYLTAATTIDPGKAVERLTGEGSRWTRVARAVTALDLTASRNQLTSYDGVPVAPGLGFQLGVGGIGGFRALEGIAASNAGASNDLVLANTIVLPGGVSIATRAQRLASRHWNRRQSNRLTLVEGAQRVLPDVAVRWTGRPWLLSGMFQSIGVNARVLRAEQDWRSAPAIASGSQTASQVRRSRQESLPIAAHLVTVWGQVTLSGSYALTRRIDSLPGSVSRAGGDERTADIAKSFALPASWGATGPLRARVSYQEGLNESFVSNAAVFGARSRLTDNGRRAFNINFDTEVTEQMLLSLQGSRVMTFDRNFNRRVVQTFLTAVFQLQFFSGGSR